MSEEGKLIDFTQRHIIQNKERVERFQKEVSKVRDDKLGLPSHVVLNIVNTNGSEEPILFQINGVAFLVLPRENTELPYQCYERIIDSEIRLGDQSGKKLQKYICSVISRIWKDENGVVTAEKAGYNVNSKLNK